MCCLPKVLERQPLLNTAYFAFCDPAGGSGGDSFTLAIGHMDYSKQTAVLDLIREVKPPFSPEQVLKPSLAT